MLPSGWLLAEPEVICVNLELVVNSVQAYKQAVETDQVLIAQ